MKMAHASWEVLLHSISGAYIVVELYISPASSAFR